MPSVLQRVKKYRLDGRAPCEDAVAWLKASRFPSARAAWEACERPDWLLWILTAAGKRDARKDRGFACRCIREMPVPGGRKVWDLVEDEWVHKAVEASERFARGEELDAAQDAAWAAARAACAAAYAAAWAAARDATYAAAYDAAWKRQAEILREIYGFPFDEEG